MKTLIALGFTFLFKIGFSVSCIWALVEFVLYLVNNNPFNWWSVGCICIAFVFMLASLLLTLASSVKDDEYKLPKPRQSFQEKLEKLRDERQKNN